MRTLVRMDLFKFALVTKFLPRFTQKAFSEHFDCVPNALKADDWYEMFVQTATSHSLYRQGFYYVVPYVLIPFKKKIFR